MNTLTVPFPPASAPTSRTTKEPGWPRIKKAGARALPVAVCGRGITLAAVVDLGNVAQLNRTRFAAGDQAGRPDAQIESIGERLLGWYAELGYDLLQGRPRGETALSPFVRHERYDLQQRTPAGFNNSGHYDIELWTLGFDLKPIHEVVFKADYQLYRSRDEAWRQQFNLALGYMF